MFPSYTQNHAHSAWIAALNNEAAVVLLALRNTVKSHIGHTPAELVYGTSQGLPGEYFHLAQPEPLPIELLATPWVNFGAPSGQTMIPSMPRSYRPSWTKSVMFSCGSMRSSHHCNLSAKAHTLFYEKTFSRHRFVDFFRSAQTSVRASRSFNHRPHLRSP